MVAAFLIAVGLLAAATIVGHGALAVCGWRGWQPWAPAVGLAVLLVVGGQMARGSGFTVPVGVTLGLLVAASLLWAPVRAALARAPAGALVLAAVVVLLAALPFAIAGHGGVLGAGISDDMSAHLLAAHWLHTHDGLAPVAARGQLMLSAGYPVGPHGLIAALAGCLGLGELDGFNGLLLALPALLAVAATALLPPRRGRSVVAGLAGLGYLPVAYLGQSAFKELVVALLLLAAVGLLDAARSEPRALLGRRLVPLGLLAAGGCSVYGYAGALWPVGAALALLAVLAVLGTRGDLVELIRLGGPAALVFAVAVAPDLGRIGRFAESRLSGGTTEGHGNLVHALNPLEATGLWLSDDFRLDPATAWPSLALGALALIALLAGLRWWWRQRRLAPPTGLAAAGALWLVLALTRNPYTSAKALVIAAPLFVVVLGAPLVAAWQARTVARVAAVVLALGAVSSSALALRATPVGVGETTTELATLRPLIGHGRVLFVGIDHYAQWALSGTDLYTAPALYDQQPVEPRGESIAPFDLDDFSPGSLDRVDWVIAPASAFAGQIPPNFRVVRRTPWLRLLRRVGPTPVRGTLEPAGLPGGILDCTSPSGSRTLRHFGGAAIVPAPVLAGPNAWRGQPTRPGRAGRVRVSLAPGRWDVSVEYQSFLPLTVTAPGLRTRLPRAPQGFGDPWPTGTLTSRGGSVTVTIAAHAVSGLAAVLGARPGDRVVRTPSGHPLEVIAFTRHGSRPRLVPTASACGRWVDWLQAAVPPRPAPASAAR